MVTVINGIQVEFGARTAERCVAFADALSAGDTDGVEVDPPP